MNNFTKITANVSGKVTKNTLEGKEYSVVPMVMMVEGVLNGSYGPLLYPTKEIAKTPEIWNHKPVVVNHPSDNNSACTIDYLNSNKIGMIMNAHSEDGKLKADAFIDMEKASAVDNRIVQNIKNNIVTELSTGLFTDLMGPAGTFNGKKYDYVAVNYRPDHLAVLPDNVGACSVNDGAGFLRLNSKKDNSAKYSIELEEIDDNLEKMIVSKVNNCVKNILDTESYSLIANELNDKVSDFEIVGVYDDCVVYKTIQEKGLYKQPFKIENSKVVFTESCIDIFEALSKNITQNYVKNRKVFPMEKQELIEALISNELTDFTEDSKTSLEKMDIDVLKNIHSLATVLTDNKENVKKDVKTVPDEDVVSKEVKNKEEKVIDSEMSVEDFIKNKVPKKLQPVLANGLQTYNQQKKLFIDKIMTNKKNIFTREILNTKELEELQGIAALAVENKKENDGEIPVLMNYKGQADPANDDSKVDDFEPLVVQNLKFD
jgi:hypothetical protein